jgi:methionyl-tRNA synthetase
MATAGRLCRGFCSPGQPWPPGSRPRSRAGLHLSLTAMSFYLTTPIYYVNSTPHIGHAYTTIIGDILVRHHRQRGERTYFLTGVDEHADKVARVAKEQGLTPKEYVDQIVVAWQELPERVNASIDFFIRTTDEGHRAFVQDFLQKIYDNGDVYQDVYAGLYCVGCEAFKTEAELVDGKCPDHGIEPEWLEEKNWFFRLSAYQDRLLQLYDERPEFVLPGFRANEARSFIAGGLRDFSISRATQTWGIPIPWDPDQVAYVWADALINYLSALSYAPAADLGFWPARHLLAKDILRFHCVYWPAMLLSAGYEPPQQLFVHGYLNIDNRKISKSLGNVLDPLDLVDEYGVDPVRFWVARVVPFGQDGDVTLDSFRERYERELANDLGNLLSRTTAMIARYRDGDLAPARNEGGELASAARALHDDILAAFDRWDVTGALDTIWDYVRRLNRHVEQTKPWELAKDPDRSGELDRALYELADGLRIAAIALSAYLPETSERILESLRQPLDVAWENVAYGRTDAIFGIEAAQPLFPRIDEPATAA